MKIKRLEIMGFKSFVDRVSLDFRQDITGVVGPNGCGKSNIVDAIRWGMGEQSAKNLRGKQMEDVIFGGSENRKPTGMAEVTLVFSTEDGVVPAKYLSFGEVQITRRLYRDGESEYFINKTHCRLMDITELFMDTGVGVKAYSIIEQGRIGVILHAKPEERRFLIEEAAGVTKYKARKQVALKKIEVTRQNLLRLSDIVAEIRRQLNALQRQVKKAEKFRQCRDELREIDLWFSVGDYRQTEAEVKEKRGVSHDLERDIQEASATLQKRDVDLEEKRIRLVEDEKTLTAAQEAIYRLKAETGSLENRLEYQKRELAGLAHQKVRLQEELTLLGRQLSDAQGELKGLEAQRLGFSTESEREETALQEAELGLEELGRLELETARRLEETRRELFSLLSEIAQINNAHGGALRRLEAMAERVKRSGEETTALQDRLVDLLHQGNELERECTALEKRKEENLHVERELVKRQNGLRGRLDAAAARLQEGERELSAVRSRLDSLRELEASLEGYGAGVRTLLKEDRFRTRFPAMVADLVETEEAYETAVEAVLGERLQSLVGAPGDVAEAVRYLKESGGGRGTFITAGLRRTEKELPPEFMPLLSRVSVPDEYRGVIVPLLEGAVLVDNLEQAMNSGLAHPWLVFVSRSGDVVADGGVVSGGGGEAAAPGIIHKKREMKQLSARVENLAGELAEHEEERNRLQRETVVVEAELVRLRQERHGLELSALTLGKDLQRVREEHDRTRNLLALKELEMSQLSEERLLLAREIDDAARGRDEREERKQRIEGEVEQLQGELAEKKRQMTAARDSVTSLKVRVASLKERREGNLRGLQRVERVIADLSARSSSHDAELRKNDAESTRLAAESARLQEQLAVQVETRAVEESRASALRSAYDDRSSLIKEEEGRLKTLRERSEELRRRHGDLQVVLSTLELRLRHLSDTIREKHGIAITDAAVETAGDAAEKRERQAELQRQVEELGEVNLAAVEEYRQLEERHAFLSSQKDDLEESLKALQQAIQKINRTTKKRFHETFIQVNDKFRELFPRLFAGGSAELRLTNEEDLLETGIDIVVQPPGKKLQNVTLLSGGEKALTALALIFSIFLIKPSPFCLLDEVDAPLDDANIGRFNGMVQEMSKVSQFIMITHNKGTMAVADTLYGITMEEPGVSKLVSVRLS